MIYHTRKLTSISLNEDCKCYLVVWTVLIRPRDTLKVRGIPFSLFCALTAKKRATFHGKRHDEDLEQIFTIFAKPFCQLQQVYKRSALLDVTSGVIYYVTSGHYKGSV